MESPESFQSSNAETALESVAAKGDRHRAESSRAALRTPRLYRLCDGFSEAVLYFMVVFSPWAFGTTQRWSTWVMNVAGYALGGLLLTKWFLRWRTGYQPPRWSDGSPKNRGEESGDENADRAGAGAGKVLTRALATLTVLILTYCLVSAINARMRYYWEDGQRFFTYLDCVNWLPHSYDQRSTWFAFWSYLGLALTFWAARDWLLGKTSRERRVSREDPLEDSQLATRHSSSFFLPARLQRLLWVLCINGAVLGLEGILQRLSGTVKLLWLVTPHLTQDAAGQFGPYAYRSNAAQYFNLVWPVCLGFWWSLRNFEEKSFRRTARLGASSHVVLLPCAILMAACPIISTSRGGAIVSAIALLITFGLLIVANRGSHWMGRLGILVLFSAMLALSGYLGWKQLEKRLKDVFNDDLSGRTEIYENTRRIARDYPVFGTGPNSFVAMYQLYRTKPSQIWQAYVHDDWLETRATFGWVGFGMVTTALALVCLSTFWPRKRRLPWLFTTMIWVALAGCLLHARFDFPFQVYSILFLFLLECAVVFGLARAR